MKVGLALGGGGVLGVAHLALLEQLDKNGIHIDGLAGTSAGAIVASLYADGGSARVNDFFDAIKKRQFFSRRNLLLTRSPDNLFKKIEELLTDTIRAKSFNDLNVPLSIIATDIDLGTRVVLSKGSVVKATMASAAYPGVFPHQKIRNMRLIDGGVTDNLPSDVTREMGCDFVIASSLNQIPILDRKIKLSRPAAAARALDIMQLELEKIQLSLADFCFLPPIEEYHWYNYEKIDQIYEKTKEYSIEIMPDLKSAIAKKAPKDFFSRLFGQ